MKLNISRATRQKLKTAEKACADLEREQTALESREQQLCTDLETLVSAVTDAENAEREAIRKAALSGDNSRLDAAHEHTAKCRARVEHAQEMLQIVQTELGRVRGEEYKRVQEALRGAQEEAACESLPGLLQPVTEYTEQLRLAWEIVSVVHQRRDPEDWLQDVFKLPRMGSRSTVVAALKEK